MSDCSPPTCSAWIGRGQHPLPADGVRILTFSPVYPKGHEMRFRIMDARFFVISSEATHFAILEPTTK
jgi:hypothetical protein